MPLFEFDSKTLSELRRGARVHEDLRFRMRCQILLRGTSLDTAVAVARQLGTSESAVRAAKRRFDDLGFDGLLDLRSGNGRSRLKLSRDYLVIVDELMQSNPRDHGFEDRRWTRFTLARAAARATGVLISPSTAGRLLCRLKPVCDPSVRVFQ